MSTEYLQKTKKGIKIFQRYHQKKHQCDWKRYKNLPKDEKQRLFEYRKNYCRMQKIIYNADTNTS